MGILDLHLYLPKKKLYSNSWEVWRGKKKVQPFSPWHMLRRSCCWYFWCVPSPQWQDFSRLGRLLALQNRCHWVPGFVGTYIATFESSIGFLIDAFYWFCRCENKADMAMDNVSLSQNDQHARKNNTKNNFGDSLGRAACPSSTLLPIFTFEVDSDQKHSDWLSVLPLLTAKLLNPIIYIPIGIVLKQTLVVPVVPNCYVQARFHHVAINLWDLLQHKAYMWSNY